MVGGGAPSAAPRGGPGFEARRRVWDADLLLVFGVGEMMVSRVGQLKDGEALRLASAGANP